MFDKFKYIAVLLLSCALISGLVHDLHHHEHIDDPNSHCDCSMNEENHLHENSHGHSHQYCLHTEYSIVDFTKKISKQNQKYISININSSKAETGNNVYSGSDHDIRLPGTAYHNKSAPLRAPPVYKYA